MGKPVSASQPSVQYQVGQQGRGHTNARTHTDTHFHEAQLLSSTHVRSLGEILLSQSHTCSSSSKAQQQAAGGRDTCIHQQDKIRLRRADQPTDKTQLLYTYCCAHAPKSPPPTHTPTPCALTSGWLLLITMAGW